MDEQIIKAGWEYGKWLRASLERGTVQTLANGLRRVDLAVGNEAVQEKATAASVLARAVQEVGRMVQLTGAAPTTVAPFLDGCASGTITAREARDLILVGLRL